MPTEVLLRLTAIRILLDQGLTRKSLSASIQLNLVILIQSKELRLSLKSINPLYQKNKISQKISSNKIWLN